MDTELYPDFVYPSSDNKLLFSNKCNYVNPDDEYQFYPESIGVIEVNPKKRRLYGDDKIRKVLFMDACGLLQINGTGKNEQIINYLKETRDEYAQNKALLTDTDLNNILAEAIKKYKKIKLTPRLKKVIFSEWCMYMPFEKQSIAAQCIAKEKREKTIALLIKLYKPGMKKHELVGISGKSLTTVKVYWEQILAGQVSTVKIAQRRLANKDKIGKPHIRRPMKKPKNVSDFEPPVISDELLLSMVSYFEQLPASSSEF